MLASGGKAARTALGAAMACLILVGGGCGAGDTDSNAMDPSPALCPGISEIAPNFMRLLREDRFSGLREVLEDKLGEPLDPTNPNGPTRLNAMLGVLLDVVAVVDVPGFRQVLLDAIRSTSVGPLLPQALGLLRYLDGRLGCPPATSCDHYDMVDALRRLLFSDACPGFGAQVELDLLARLVKYPRLPELIDLFPRLLQNPTLQSVLDGFTFEGCSSPPCQQENGFVALLDILLDNVLVSPLPWDDIRSLLAQVNLSTPEVDELIDLAEDLLTESPADPDADVLTPLRAAIRCLRQVDPERRLTHNLYRVLTLDEVSLDGLLEGIDRLLDADPQRLTLEVLKQALDFFRKQNINSYRTLQVVLDVLLAPENMRKVIPALIVMIENDVIPELADLLLALTGDCTALGGS